MLKFNKPILILCLFSVSWTADFFTEWLENTFSTIDSTGIEVKFDYQYFTESGERSAGGYIRYGDPNHFLYKIGKKTVFAVDSVWKTYDASTNQVFIHTPDVQFQQMVLKWFNQDSLSSPQNIHQINSRAYTVQFSEDTSPFDVYFSDQKTLEQIIVYGQDYSLIINIRSLNPITSELKDPFKLDLPDAFELDLRE